MYDYKFDSFYLDCLNAREGYRFFQTVSSLSLILLLAAIDTVKVHQLCMKYNKTDCSMDFFFVFPRLLEHLESKNLSKDTFKNVHV